jgi:hypothetical protein
MPRESFNINESVLDKNGLPTGKYTIREVKEITIVRGSHDDIQGWHY